MTEHSHLERIVPTPETLFTTAMQGFEDHLQRYEFAKNYIAGKIVADIACGVGYGTWMLSETAAEVHGFDIDEDSLEHARQHFTKANTRFEHASNLPTDTFDVVCSFETLEHMDEATGDAFIADLYRAAKAGGVLILSTPLNRGTKRDYVTPFHVREYDDREVLQKLQKAGWQIEESWGQQSFASRVTGRKVGSVSLQDIMRSGIHRVIPSPARLWLRDCLLGKGSEQPAESLKIVRDGLDGAFVQIWVARKPA